MEEDILGKDLRLAIYGDRVLSGIGIDLAVDRRGDLRVASGRDNLGQAILHRLLTRKGELTDLGHPDYGSRLYELIGEPNNERTRELVRIYVKECLSQEVRIQDFVGITVTVPKENPYAVLLDVTVLPIHTTVPMNIVFPFYLEVS